MPKKSSESCNVVSFSCNEVKEITSKEISDEEIGVAGSSKPIVEDCYTYNFCKKCELKTETVERLKLV